MGERSRQSHGEEFDKLLNFRDVSNIVNDNAQKQILRPGKLYRSARPDDTSVNDRKRLVNDFQVKTIVDLRSKTEHIEATQKYSKSVQAAKSSLVPASNDLAAQALKIRDVNYAEINLNGKGFERHLVWQLSYGNLARLAGNMLFGYRLEGISILGKSVLQPRGLIGLGKDTLQHSGPEIKEVFDVMAQSKNWPVLVHCTQGKDRTGLIVLLVLLLCGIDVESITQDYTTSEAELAPEFEERMKEISSIGLDESFARCPKDFVRSIVEFINQKYGGIEQYLDLIGVLEDQRNVIRKELVS